MIRCSAGFQRGIRTAKEDPSARISYWTAALQLYEKHPVWGVGPGHYDVEFGQVRPVRVQDRPQFAHCDYLNTLCDWGTVGMGIVAATCALLAWGAVETWNAVRRRGNDFGSSIRSDRTAFLVGASAAIFTAMLHSIVEFNMQIPAERDHRRCVDLADCGAGAFCDGGLLEKSGGGRKKWF